MKRESGEQKCCYGINKFILYKHENAVGAGTSQEGGYVTSVIAVVRGGTLGHGDDELALGVGGGGHGGARAGREAEAPPVELEGGGGPVVGADAGGQVPHDDLGDAGVDLDGVRVCAAFGEAFGGGDEAELRGVLLDGDVGVGGEGELEHLGEDVREAPQLLRASRREDGGRGAALDGDGALPRGRVDPHGARLRPEDDERREARSPNPRRAREGGGGGGDRALGGGRRWFELRGADAELRGCA